MPMGFIIVTGFIAFIVAIVIIGTTISKRKTGKAEAQLTKLSHQNPKYELRYINRRIDEVIEALLKWKYELDYDLINPYMTHRLLSIYKEAYGEPATLSGLAKIGGRNNFREKNGSKGYSIEIKDYDIESHTILGIIKSDKRVWIPGVNFQLDYGNRREMLSAAGHPIYFKVKLTDDWRLDYLYREEYTSKSKA